MPRGDHLLPAFLHLAGGLDIEGLSDCFPGMTGVKRDENQRRAIMSSGCGSFIIIERGTFEDNGLTESDILNSPVTEVPEGLVVAWFTTSALARRVLAAVGFKEDFTVASLTLRELVEWLEAMEAEGVEFVSLDPQVVQEEFRLGISPITEVLPILKRFLAEREG
jgi:hypothetical protein